MHVTIELPDEFAQRLQTKWWSTGEITFQHGAAAGYGPDCADPQWQGAAAEAMLPADDRGGDRARVRGSDGIMPVELLHDAYGAEREAIVQNHAVILPWKRLGAAGDTGDTEESQL